MKKNRQQDQSIAGDLAQYYKYAFGPDHSTVAHQVVLIPIVRGMVELENIFIMIANKNEK